MSSTVFNLLKYIHFVHGFGRKFYTFAFSSLTFKGFWKVVVYPFYEQVNICLLSSMVWTLLRGFGHLPSIDIVYSLHACFFFFRLLFIDECIGEVFVPSLSTFVFT